MLALMRNKPLANEGSLVLRYFCTKVTFNNSFIGKKTDENIFFQQNCLFTPLSLSSHVEAN